LARDIPVNVKQRREEDEERKVGDKNTRPFRPSKPKRNKEAILTMNLIGGTKRWISN
jgi:hypothetical protein